MKFSNYEKYINSYDETHYLDINTTMFNIGDCLDYLLVDGWLFYKTKTKTKQVNYLNIDKDTSYKEFYLICG